VYRVGDDVLLCIAVGVTDIGRCVFGLLVLCLCTTYVALISRYLVHVGHLRQWDIVVAQKAVPQESLAPHFHHETGVHVIRFAAQQTSSI